GELEGEDPSDELAIRALMNVLGVEAWAPVVGDLVEAEAKQANVAQRRHGAGEPLLGGPWARRVDALGLTRGEDLLVGTAHRVVGDPGEEPCALVGAQAGKAAFGRGEARDGLIDIGDGGRGGDWD